VRLSAVATDKTVGGVADSRSEKIKLSLSLSLNTLSRSLQAIAAHYECRQIQ
jgi:hypothetical protein